MALGYLTPSRRGAPTGGGLGTGSLFDLHRQVNRLFDDLLEGGPLARSGASGTAWPQIEIEQDDERIQVVAELPGVDEKDVEISIEEGVLAISGEKRTERKDENGYSERSYGRFERRISLPGNVDEDACSADLRNGVLTITIPRAAEKARGRRIPLGGSSQSQQLEAQNDASEAPRQQAAEEAGRSDQQEGQQS